MKINPTKTQKLTRKQIMEEYNQFDLFDKKKNKDLLIIQSLQSEKSNLKITDVNNTTQRGSNVKVS